MSMIVLSHDSEDEILLKQNISSPLNPSLDCCDEEKLKPKFIAAAAGTRSLKQDPESIIANDEGGKVTQGEKSSSFSCQKYSTTANTSQQSNESFSSVPLLRRDSLLTTTSNNPEAENSSISASTGTIASSPSKLDILRARHKMLQNTSCQKIEVVRRSLSDGSSSYCNNSFNNSKPCQIFAKSSNNSDYLDDDLTVEASFWSESHRSPQPATAVQQQQQQNLALMKPPKEVVLIGERGGSNKAQSSSNSSRKYNSNNSYFGCSYTSVSSSASTSQTFRTRQNHPQDCLQHHLQRLQTENDRLYVELSSLRKELRNNRESFLINKFTFAVLLFLLIIMCAPTSIQQHQDERLQQILNLSERFTSYSQSPAAASLASSIANNTSPISPSPASVIEVELGSSVSEIIMSTTASNKNDRILEQRKEKLLTNNNLMGAWLRFQPIPKNNK